MSIFEVAAVIAPYFAVGVGITTLAWCLVVRSEKGQA